MTEMGNKNNDNNLIDPVNIKKKHPIIILKGSLRSMVPSPSFIIWCAQQKPPCYAGWLKGGVDFLKKMRTRHLPARNIPSEFSDCTFLAFKLLLKIKKKWLVNSNVGELVQHVLVSVITRFWPNLHQIVENTLFRWRFYLKKIIIWNRIVDTNNYGWFDRVMLRDGTSHNHDICSFYSFSTRCKQMPGILAYLLV